MKKTDVYIGIDPDIDKNGVAFVEVETRRCEVASLTFPELMDYLAFVVQRHEETGQTVTVVVEAGWLEESNWHLRQKGVAWAASVGRAVGRNHQTGIIIADMAEHMGLPVIRQRPLRKCWRGKDRKITHAELAAFTGIMGRTNQEERDALLLAWVAVMYYVNEKLLAYLKKGVQVYASGDVRISTYTNKDNKTSVDVTLWAKTLQLVGRREEQQSSQYEQQAVKDYLQRQGVTATPTDVDVPF